HNKLSCNLAYYKASLIKVIDVLITDAVLSLRLLYKPELVELALDYLRILAKGSLVVVLSIKLNYKLWATLNERASPVLANRRLVALSK
ncbi:uncharacterized protein M421DRAFT_66300, partial [Didymella exigua CBS 183.55]